MKRARTANRPGLVRLLGVIGVASWLAFSSATAHAYSYRTCEGNRIRWNSGWTNMYLNTTSIPVGSSWDSRLQNAMWHWNNVKGAGFNYYVGRDTDGSFSHSNGVNEVYFTSSATDVGTALAVTKSRYSCYWLFGWQYGLVEADIGFNSTLSWSTGAYSYAASQGPPFNFESVALHELGHALGLKHEDRWMATMNAFYPNSGPFGYYKEWDAFGDDRLGIRFLYPDATTESDIAASPLKRTDPGESDLVSSPLSAARGSYVTINFTFSNLSTASKTFNVGFYLSRDSYISTADTFLGSNTGAWGSAGFTGTFSRTLWIPGATSPGTYYLGFIVDHNGAVGENHEGNNGQPMPRTIRIY